MTTLAPSHAFDGRGAVTVAALMAAYMEAVNISLPNATLPHIQGTLSMANDEAGWVFTAYIAAGALVVPMTRWLAGRYGRRMIYQLSLLVFCLGLMLDTMAATSLSSCVRSMSAVAPPERPMMKCTRTSGPSGKYG